MSKSKETYGPMKDNIREVFGASKQTFEIILKRKVDPATGKRRAFTRRVIGTLRDARAMKNAMIVELAEEAATGITSKANVTVGACLLRYLEESEPFLHNKTFESFTHLINGRLMKSFGHLRLDALTWEVIQRESIKWSKEGKLQPIRCGDAVKLKCGISPSGVNRHLVLLSSVMKRCIRPWNLIRENPVSYVQRLKVETHNRETLSWPEIVVLFKEMKKRNKRTSDIMHNRTQAIIFLAIFTGMRRGELFGLSWRNIDFEAETIVVKQVIEYTKAHGVQIKPFPKNHSSVREICFDQHTREVLKTLKAEYSAMKLRLGKDFDTQNLQLVFGDHAGNAYRPENFSVIYNRLIKRAGIKHISIHDLRHTHATLLGDEDVAIEAIRDRLGHSKGSITGHYRHRSRTVDKALQAKLVAAYERNVLASAS